MKQDEFIEALRRELSSLPKQAVDEIVADYREYIGDALAAGRREEDLIAALGDPVKLARELKAQANYRQWQSRRSLGNLFRVMVSIAGLGLLNVLLLVPFMLYLAVLTIGYVTFTGLTIAGIVGVVALSGHHLFSTPAHGIPSIHFGSREHDKSANANSVNASATPGNDKGSEESPGNLKDLKIVGNRFVFDLQDGSRVSMVTRAGPIEMRREDDQLNIETPSDGARQLLTKEKDGTLSVRRDEVLTLDVRNDDDDRVSFASAGPEGKSDVWKISSDDGDRVQIEEDAHGNTSSLSANSGPDSMQIRDGSVDIADGRDRILVHASGGKYNHLVAMLPMGVLGLLFCVWLTRMSWRAVTRYVKRQIDVVSASLDRDPTS
ncbi:MAG TPA: DUF1700 domain-containing protein [Trinickia sp.]|jgi:uncharacterized membrane protein|uniref:DUF1700 domain-containing protein n=1 Tax=Trinickia sp. TaxID=2571163 RepID=UPI002D04E03F|nr:DUF1700 domain-containing protein [Trinickia sp.]HTI19068.1 DUF1700 domain-containing protein [Trinickia sp.]